MRLKNLLFLAVASLFTASAWAQSEYTFVPSEWPAGDAGRISPSNVVADDAAGTITVNQSGTNNVALIFRGPAYTIASEKRFFVIKGTGLSTADGASYLWWLNNGNDGSHKPGYVWEEDGVTVLAWDILALPSQLSGKFNIYSSTSTLTNAGGWSTTFGLTLADDAVPAVISYIGFEEEAQGAELPNEYQFVPSQWVAGDAGRISPSNVVADDAAGTITVDKSGNNNVALHYKPGKLQYVEPDKKFFVIKGTGLSTADGASYLWWLNNSNNGSQISPYTQWEEDGKVCMAWDIATTGIGGSFHIGTGRTYLNFAANWTTTFGLTLADAGVPAVIDYIGFDAELPAVIDYTPYTFQAEDWVAGDPARTSADEVTILSGNKIKVNSTGQNNVALKFKTDKFYTVEADQIYFVIKASGVATGAGDARLWWLNGANHASQPEPVITWEENGETVLAWDIEATGLNDNFETEGTTNLVNNGDWNTTFGLTQAEDGVPVVISYIGFDKKVKAALSEEVAFAPVALKKADVTLARTLVADGDLSTLVLPFDLTEVQVAEAFGTGTEVYVFMGDATADDKTIVNFAAATTISAGQPVLIKPATAGTNYTFSDVEVKTAEPVTAGTSLSLTGTYETTQVAEGDFVLTSNNVFKKSAGASTVKGFRAYFHRQGETGVKALSLNLDGVLTAIQGVETGHSAQTAVYNLAGQRVAKAVKGIYVINGKKVVIK